MMDPKLAKGMTKRFLADLAPRMYAVCDEISSLKIRRNLKSQARMLRRLEAKHAPMVGPVYAGRNGGLHKAIIPSWAQTDIEVINAEYAEVDSLTAATHVFRIGRTNGEFETIFGPLTLHHHAIRRMVERDNTLPVYSWQAWLRHFELARNMAWLMAAVPSHLEDDQSVGPPLAMPTAGGLFVCFMIRVLCADTGRRVWEVSAHSFYGQHELDEAQQKLHANLIAAYEAADAAAVVAAHENYGWDRLWPGQRPKLLRAAEVAA